MNKEILINIEPQEKRLAVLENKVLEEFSVERFGEKRVVGNVYKGRVSSVVPAVKAAFVSLGLEKNGYLYLADVVGLGMDFEALDKEEEEKKQQQRGRQNHQSIDQLLKKGQEVLIQVTKEPFGTKGARLTTHISLPGRYIVLLPFDRHLGISRRISDDKERVRLKEILRGLEVPAEMGVIIRTAGIGQTKRELSRDLKYLLGLWRKIKIGAARKSSPALLHEEYDLTLRVARDYLTEDVEKLVIDNRDEYRKVQHFLSAVAPHLRQKVELYEGDIPLFDRKMIEKDVEKLFERKVPLKCGGYIVIEPTEGLVAIDVNSGKFTAKKSLEETAFAVNTEAAIEVARQIRLRDLGGIIVIDFIDMMQASRRRKVFETMVEALKRDKAKTDVSPLSELCLVEMTRQRMRRSVESMSFRECPYCQGRGLIKSVSTVSIQALRKVKKYLKETKKKQVELHAHPEVASRLFNEDRPAIETIERIFRAKIIVKADPLLHVEDIKLI
ncbi:MAG: Rne/Rng family ribonuclease [Candidatus Omnitrophota bacterium]